MRKLHEIADDIVSASMDSPGNRWYWSARPYVEAMQVLDSVDEYYGADSGESIVLYALSNLQGWRGDMARSVKAELKAMVK